MQVGVDLLIVLLCIGPDVELEVEFFLPGGRHFFPDELALDHGLGLGRGLVLIVLLDHFIWLFL